MRGTFSCAHVQVEYADTRRYKISKVAELSLVVSRVSRE